ncbi:tRNA wybutosine-synthesizing protein 3 homolog isoform X2 [Pleurodeles waltl]|uniref:tRNA wybutosine-synthesizing protein 3 homolog isoform X2 n=1 Tax=Pleurodeles waltl TaxID=8319 RepID=UPI0037099980
MALSEEFKKWKQQCLNKADFSKKGSVDADIADLVQYLNARDHFFTTSSCSGRIILIDTQCSENLEVQKQNRSWLFVTHEKCKKNEVVEALQNSRGDAVLKFEAFVLHVQCQLLEDAQILAVRSTHCLEVPLSKKGRLMVNDEYIDYIVQIANQKMEENKHRIARFYSCMQSALSVTNCVSGTEEDFHKTGPVYTRRRKKNKETRNCNLFSLEDSESDVDLQTGLFVSEEH